MPLTPAASTPTAEAGMSSDLQGITWIHRHLRRWNPLSPSDLLNQLHARPDLLDPTTGPTLVAYSRRWTDHHTEARLKEMMMRKRMTSLRLMRKTEDLEATEKHRRRPNQRYFKAFPPLPAGPSRRTARDLLSHLHGILLDASPDHPPPTLEQVLGVLSGISLDEEQVEIAREALHLYLANPSSNCDSGHLIEIFTRMYPSAKLSRQTLHLVLISILWPESALPPANINSKPTTDIGAPAASKDHERAKQSPNQPPPTASREALRVIRAFRSRYRITPGLESYRHLAQYAIQNDATEVSQIAWVGWWDEYDRLRSGVEKEEEARRQRAALNDLQRVSLEYGSETPLKDEQVEPKTEILNFRFRHLGQQFLRWRNQVMSKLRGKGWIERVEVMARGDQESRKMWIWLGKKGEEAEIGRKHQRWLVREAKKRAKDMGEPHLEAGARDRRREDSLGIGGCARVPAGIGVEVGRLSDWRDTRGEVGYRERAYQAEREGARRS
ncbi:MAG: hypothetical protein TREMPRED_002275 [Tremellales sp. Tagirdzhanova-0007]|nr:MAG: hypothetical protein TREMPRED_002275 [Tremellales sp. Tagirdzhanova-0007]